MIQMDKKTLRREIADRKKQFPASLLDQWSESIRLHIESTDVFRKAEGILLYHSLPGEVQTHTMLSHWVKTKSCYLPQIEGDHLNVRCYEGKESLRQGQMGIWEPVGALCTDYRVIDLVIVPGVAFDKEGNRLGRGKGYYDRLLPLIPAHTMGICFHFQLVEGLPVERFDVRMAQVITEQFSS